MEPKDISFIRFEKLYHLNLNQTANTITHLAQKLNTVNVPIIKTSVEDAKKLISEHKACLNEVYTIIVSELPQSTGAEHSQYLNLLGEVLTKFGRIRYEENYPSCMVLMRASFNAQLTSLGLYNNLHFEVSGNLNELETRLFNHKDFLFLDIFMIRTDPNTLADLINYQNLSPESLFNLGFTLSWLANSLHHTKGYRNAEESEDLTFINHRRFDIIYSLCDKILTLSNTNPAKLERAEMYYNGLRGVELRKDPKNLESAHHWLDLAMELNTSLEFAARVTNIKSVDFSSVGNFEKAIELLNEAIKIRESFPKDSQDPFLVANLNCRKAGFLLKEKKFEEANEAIDKALEYATVCRGERNPSTGVLLDSTHDHQYFGIYDTRKAEIKIGQGKYDEAIVIVGRALETFERHLDDSKELIDKAKEIKLISKAALN